MKTIKVTRSTVCAGKDLIAGKTYELEDKNANLLVGLGKAIEVESEADIGIEEDTTVAIEDMKKNDLVEYAASLGIDVPSKANKDEIIALINAHDEEDEEGEE